MLLSARMRSLISLQGMSQVRTNFNVQGLLLSHQLRRIQDRSRGCSLKGLVLMMRPTGFKTSPNPYKASMLRATKPIPIALS